MLLLTNNTTDRQPKRTSKRGRLTIARARTARARSLDLHYTQARGEQERSNNIDQCSSNRFQVIANSTPREDLPTNGSHSGE